MIIILTFQDWVIVDDVYTGMSHFTLCLTLLQFRYCFFFLKQFESLWQPCAELLSVLFSNCIIHFVFPVSHVGNSCNISNFLIIIVLLLCWERLKAGGEGDDKG